VEIWNQEIDDEAEESLCEEGENENDAEESLCEEGESENDAEVTGADLGTVVAGARLDQRIDLVAHPCGATLEADALAKGDVEVIAEMSVEAWQE